MTSKPEVKVLKRTESTFAKIDQMKCSHELFDSNSSHWNREFEDIDNRAAMLGEWMAIHNQEDRDKSLITSFFSSAWKILHVMIPQGIAPEGNGDVTNVVATYNALVRIGQGHMLTEGLNSVSLNWLTQACENAKER